MIPINNIPVKIKKNVNRWFFINKDLRHPNQLVSYRIDYNFSVNNKKINFVFQFKDFSFKIIDKAYFCKIMFHKIFFFINPNMIELKNFIQ